MKKYFPVSLFFILFILFSCKPKQNMVYMSNDNFKEEVSRAKYQGLHIQEGDILEITVSAFDELAIKPFNKTTMSQTGEQTTGSVATRLGNNEYQVNSEAVSYTHLDVYKRQPVIKTWFLLMIKRHLQLPESD